MLTTTIRWPCYCAVHVYVVIHIYDSMWGFFSGSESAQGLVVFFRLLIYKLPIEIQLSRGGGGWDSKPKPHCVPVPRKYLDCQRYIAEFLCSVKMRCNCSFLYIGQNWWPLLFLNILLIMLCTFRNVCWCLPILSMLSGYCVIYSSVC